MRLIDKTPFQDAQGNISVIARGQGALKYGPNWYPEVEAQKLVIAQLERLLDKGFVLIRNLNLPESDIIIPVILLGPGSLTVMLASPVKGHFEAKGTEWNILKDGTSTPASRNLVELLSKLTRAFNKYLQLENIVIPFQPEPVLITTDPGTVVESIRPALRVVRSDAVTNLAKSLNSLSPVLKVEQVVTLADQIADPALVPSQPPPGEAPPTIKSERPLSRAQAIFKASEEPGVPPTLLSTPKPAPAKQAAPPRKRAGVSGMQLFILIAMTACGCCAIGGLIYYLFFLS
jgi:hypothetical protein